MYPELRTRSEALLATLPDAPQSPRPLVELDGSTVTPEALTEASADLRRPVVIRGVARDFPAVQAWSEPLLRARLGALPVTATNIDTGEHGFSSAPDVHLSFGDYLDRMAHEPLYLFGSTGLFDADPALLDDICLDEIQHRLLGAPRFFAELLAAQLFVGSPQTFSRLHHAFGGNFFLQIAGRKRWTLLSPDYTPHLMPLPARPFLFSYSGFGGYRKRQQLGKPLGLLERLPRHQVTLEPGDILYNAPWWWHEVENLDDFTVGTAVRHIPPPHRPSPTWRNHPLMTAMSTYPSSRLLLRALTVYRWLSGAEEPLTRDLNRRTTARVRRGLRAAQAQTTART